VQLIDAGDGEALPAFIASFPASVNAVLRELRSTTGVDIAGVLSGEAKSIRGTPSLGSGGSHG
jgi:hypothetical protein